MSLSPSTSLAAVASWQVQKAAANLHASILGERQKDREISIQNVMKGRKVRVGWFRKRAVTREEAIDIVDNERTEYGFRQFSDHLILGERWIIRSNELIAACELCEEGIVYLGIEDAKTVKDYLNWKSTIVPVNS